MTHILSYGGGVNSTAIIALALLGELPMPDYIVFSDTGAEWPFTYTYINHLESKGIKITYLTGGDKFKDLIEFCDERKIVPSRLNRWCSDHWKITPVRKFARAFDDVEMWVGIDAGEAHRAEKRRNKQTRFPLIELGMNRLNCKAVLLRADLGIPQKSGCFICPYQRKRQWIELKKWYPNMWEIAVRLEKQSRERSPDHTLSGSAWGLEEYVADLHKQEELDFGITLDQRCECYFD